MPTPARERWAALPYGVVRRVSFAGAELTSVVARTAFDRVVFDGADLRDADLRDTSFSIVMTGADNGRTNLTGVRWQGANLAGATFEDVIGDVPGAEDPS
jgi:uncharacterized protein YjbI with pentapeptide repeats